MTWLDLLVSIPIYAAGAWLLWWEREGRREAIDRAIREEERRIREWRRERLERRR